MLSLYKFSTQAISSFIYGQNKVKKDQPPLKEINKNVENIN